MKRISSNFYAAERYLLLLALLFLPLAVYLDFQKETHDIAFFLQGGVPFLLCLLLLLRLFKNTTPDVWIDGDSLVVRLGKSSERIGRKRIKKIVFDEPALPADVGEWSVRLSIDPPCFLGSEITFRPRGLFARQAKTQEEVSKWWKSSDPWLSL